MEVITSNLRYLIMLKLNNLKIKHRICFAQKRYNKSLAIVVIAVDQHDVTFIYVL